LTISAFFLALEFSATAIQIFCRHKIGLWKNAQILVDKQQQKQQQRREWESNSIVKFLKEA